MEEKNDEPVLKHEKKWNRLYLVEKWNWSLLCGQFQSAAYVKNLWSVDCKY